MCPTRTRRFGPERLREDMSRAAGGAMGFLGGIKGEIDNLLRQQVEKVAAELDLVPREDFEAVRAMAAKSRTEQDALIRRIAELEARLAKLEK